MIVRPLVLAAVLVAGLAACSDDAPAGPTGAVQSALDAPVPGVTLPPDPLLPLVPAPDEVPAGMVPVLTGSGPRDVDAVAAYSADPAAARTALVAHGFAQAYVAQYAEPGAATVLSVVVVRFRDAAGARADLDGDLAASAGEVVRAAPVGEQSRLVRQPLPGAGGGQLLTLRFRTASTTWLVAYGDAPEADVSVPVGLGQRLVVREGST